MPCHAFKDLYHSLNEARFFSIVFVKLKNGSHGIFFPLLSFFLFSQPGRHDSPSSSLNYVHKIHTATTSTTSKSASEESLKTPTKLWSVARLSLECNNNNNNNNNSINSNTFEERNSFYQHLSQMQHKNFHHIDTSASNASSSI